MSSSAVALTTAETPKDFHIFGSGISFSISPIIHNAGFQHYGLPHTYDIRESKTIDQVGNLIEDEKFGGASVTMPHKLHVHKFCAEQTDTARLIGAINTLLVKQSGNERIIIGENTDWSGLHSIIASYAKKTNQQPTTGLVIGAGGASRAALYAMHRSGLEEIYIVNRTLSVAEKVKSDFERAFQINVLANLGELPCLPDVVIGTVPADTTTEEQFSAIFGPRGLCIDMAYKPRQTPLLTVAQKYKEWRTVTGLEVLLAQAYDQFRMWTGLEPPMGKMDEAVFVHEQETGNNRAGML